MRRRRILFTGFVYVAYGGHESAEVRDVRRTGERHGLRGGGRKNRGWGVCLTTLDFRYQRRAVDESRRGGMAQDGGERGGRFHGELDRCRESQGWTTACSGMPKRDKEGQGDDSPNQACSCWFARHT